MKSYADAHHSVDRRQRHPRPYPTALYLAGKAKRAEFDTAFYDVQARELVAAVINITLLHSTWAMA